MFVTRYSRRRCSFVASTDVRLRIGVVGINSNARRIRPAVRRDLFCRYSDARHQWSIPHRGCVGEFFPYLPFIAALYVRTYYGRDILRGARNSYVRSSYARFVLALILAVFSLYVTVSAGGGRFVAAPFAIVLASSSLTGTPATTFRQDRHFGGRIKYTTRINTVTLLCHGRRRRVRGYWREFRTRVPTVSGAATGARNEVVWQVRPEERTPGTECWSR